MPPAIVKRLNDEVRLSTHDRAFRVIPWLEQAKDVLGAKVGCLGKHDAGASGVR
jgi:hypothetical protein